MPWFVNGQPVPEELIHRELAQIGRHPNWANIADEKERAHRMSEAAERSAQDKMLIAQAAARTSGPSIRRRRTGGRKAEAGWRLPHRLCRYRAAPIGRAQSPRPTPHSGNRGRRGQAHRRRGGALLPVEPRKIPSAGNVSCRAYREARERESIRGAGGSCNPGSTGRPGDGMPFGEAAARHSDCKGNGGDLGTFPAGHMVDEFESVIRARYSGSAHLDGLIWPTWF